MDLIITGKANWGTVVSPEIGLDEAPPVHEKFDKREEIYEGNHSSE
jgi:hypothetical protein